ncbi:TP53-binding protein 1 isoform 2-T3 [Salvelinus alpinus]
MDPSGSDLDSSLPHAENPCLIVEDSQPDSAALEDDPDSSYRALLARRLSSLQPATSHSPVLELISSPAGNRYSETDSQSERVQNNNHNGPVNQEESQVLEVCSNTRRCVTEDMATESGADSTTHCAQSEGGVSKFDFLELSESQGLGEVVGNSQEEEGPTAAQTDSQRHNKPGEQKNTTRGLPSGSQDSKSKRSEVSSSSSSEPLGCAGRELSVQALLHSQGLQASEDQDPKGDDSELLSSQEDLFNTDKTGTGVDSTMSEPENEGVPTLTPAHTLRLLHLSGQGTLVQESLSQNSVDFVAPTQENLSQTPFIVPNSPTGQENELGADEPMDTSMPPEDQSDGKEEEPMDMDPAPKSHPSASTPVSQNSPGFVLERTLSLPTQPEFSHDVFVPTQSQEAGSSSIAPQETHSRKVTSSSSQPTALDSSSPKMAAAPAQSKAPTTTDREQSVTDSFQLELSVNTQSCSLAQQASMQAGGKDVEEDSQATQIEEGLDGPLQIDTSDSVISRNSQKRESNGVPSDPKTPAIFPKVPQVPDLLKTSGESTRREECNTSQKSDTHKQTTLNVRNVNIGDDGINVTKTDSSQKQDAKASSPSPSSQQKLETIDLFTPSSCVQETPSSSNSAPCSLASLSQSQSQSVFSQMSHVGSVKALSPSPGVCVDSRRDGGGRREAGGGVGSPTSSQKNRDPSKSIQSLSQERGGTATNSPKEKNKADEEEEEGMEEGGEKQQDSTLGPEGSGLYLSLSQSQVLSPEPMEEEEEEKRGKFSVSHSRSEGGRGEEESCSSIIVLEESERSSQLLEKEVKSPSNMGTSQPVASRRGSVSSYGTGSQLKDTQLVPIGLAQVEKEGSREAEGLRDKSLSDSSGEIPFHFTLPKEGELIGPPVSATPPLISQLKQTPRHSTPIDMTSFSEKSAAVGDVSTETAMATSEITAGESGEDTAEGADGKLSLRMKLVTPVEEGSSERFSLQKPPQSDEEGSVSKVTTVVKAVTSPSVFSRVREAHRQVMEDQAEAHPSDPGTPVRGELFSSPSQQKSSQRPSIPSPSLECISLPNSQSEPLSSPRQEVKCTLPLGLREKEPPAEPSTPGRPAVKTPQKGTAAGDRGPCGPPEPSTPTRAAAIRQRAVSQQTSFDNTVSPSSPSKGEPETPPSRAAAGPAHQRHVRTIQEVRTTVTRIITDVYYEDGREVDRKVTEESEEPVVDSRVLDSDISLCRTGSSMTSGDLGDVSSLSSKASSLQHSSGGTSIVTGPAQRGPDFIMPPSRGAKSARGAGVPRANARGQPLSSEDEPYTRLCPTPHIPDSPAVPSHSSTSLLTTTSQDEGSPAGSSFVGLRVVAKWSSNGYFYSGRITKDLGEGRYRLLFDDSYECEVMGKDILLCDPIPLDTEVTALLEDEYFSTGRVKDYKKEGEDLFYSVEKQGQTTAAEREGQTTATTAVEREGQTTATTAVEREGQTTATTAVEREGQTTATTAVEREGQTTATTAVERQWYSRSSVILTMEQGNRLREQYGLGPYEPSTPLAKASDISLDNLVEGKRRRRGITGGASPLTPGPSGKRKLISSEDRDRTPAKRGRRGGGGARAGQRVGVCNTSGSGTDLPWDHSDLAETHGPLPQSASLFLGFAFMLTASSESDRQTNQPISDGEEEYVQTAPYHKRYTETQLEAGAGFILHDFNEEQCKAAYQSLLITDQHSRTRKYLLCVASGVPCVSHIWVRDCCKEGKLLNYRNYLLPAGVGPDERIVEWHPRCSPFKALRVLLVFGEPAELWSELLMMNGASSVRQHQAEKDSSDIPVGKFDVVVTDRTCPPLVLKSVTSQEVPMVSPEWLIHSLICGERLGYHSNPQYRHDYTSSS